jgi:hypothetical protein
MRRAQKETVGLNVGTRGNIAAGGFSDNPPVDSRPTLAEQGIDKNLAHQDRWVELEAAEPPRRPDSKRQARWFAPRWREPRQPFG